MHFKYLLVRFFLPLIGLFFCLSLLFLQSNVQQLYYGLWENVTLTALEKNYSDIYFKAKPGTKADQNNYEKIRVLFNDKASLYKIKKDAESKGINGVYDYFGFVVNINETYITPFLFFICLLIATPGNWLKKGIGCIIGIIIISGFIYLSILYKGQYFIADAIRHGYTVDDLKLYKILYHFFSSVTIITVVLFVWLVIALQVWPKKDEFILGMK